eukprot:CCRYP_010548-RA/>CCRYP_010548-RA protein AED:0.23 eAED:0.23 QI:76/1/1/1/1/1/2/1541/397
MNKWALFGIAARLTKYLPPQLATAQLALNRSHYNTPRYFSLNHTILCNQKINLPAAMNLSTAAMSLRCPTLRIGSSILAARARPSLHLLPSHHQPSHRHFSTASAAQVKQLRLQTGAPMMECKKALSSSDGDLAKAMEWLRKHGTQKASAKVTGREAPEGLVGIRVEKDAASLVKVASETDFASRSETFSGFVQEVADAAAVASCEPDNDGQLVDVTSFLSTSTNDSGKSLSECLNDVILSIRENIQVDSISLMKASTNSVLGGYVHNRIAGTNCGSAAAIVELQSLSDKGVEKADETAKKLAMHVVAARPLYLNPESVPTDILEKEKDILMAKMVDTNKPPEILDKIISGQLRKFYEQICLTEQSHMVEEGNPKVGNFLKGLGMEVKNFKFMGTSK